MSSFKMYTQLWWRILIKVGWKDEKHPSWCEYPSKYLPWWTFMHGCLCESIFFTGCFCSGRLVFPVSIPPDRKREGMKERKRERYRERDRNTENERTHWDKLITSGLVSLSYASESTEVFCLADSVFGWDVFGARIHTDAVIFLNGWATITLTHRTAVEFFFSWEGRGAVGLWLFYLHSNYFILPTALKQTTEWPSKWLRCSRFPFHLCHF